MSGRPPSAWAWLNWLPIRHRDQALLAECLSQALDAGLPVPDALAAAAEVSSSPRLRVAVRQAIIHFRSGYPLPASLSRTGVRVSGGLLAALQVGEDRGCLAEELAAFARRGGKRPPTPAGRSAAATQFASALARLLSDRRLTPGLVEDAGRVAAAGSARFAGVIEEVVEDMRDGAPFADALGRHPGEFDPLFRRCVEAAADRQRLRAVLLAVGRLTLDSPATTERL